MRKITTIKAITAILLFFGICFVLGNLRTVYAEEELIESGAYDGVPWRAINGDEGIELIIGQEGKEYTFDYKEKREYDEYPWQHISTPGQNIYASAFSKVVFEGVVHGNGSCGGMFKNFGSLSKLDISGFDTSGVTDMSWMFAYCDMTPSLDLTGLDTSNVTDMSHMFEYCLYMRTLNISCFNTSKVKNMEYMFEDCTWLQELDVSNFDTSNVTNMGHMFEACRTLTSLDVTGFDTGKVENMAAMFCGCQLVESLDVTKLDTSNVTDMSFMFDRCRALTRLDLSGLKTANVTSMAGMFSECSALESLDVSPLDTSKVEDFASMFYKCGTFSSLDLSTFDTKNAKKMGGMFFGCNNLTSLTLTSFDTALVEDMSYMFYKCENLEKLDLSSSNTCSVTDFSHMFDGCLNLKKLDIPCFDTSSAVNMGYMFTDCRALKVLDLSSFNACNAVNMGDMFYRCDSLTILIVGHYFNATAEEANIATFPHVFYDSNDGTLYEEGSPIPNTDVVAYVIDMSIDPGNPTGIEDDALEVHADFKTAYDDKEREFTGEKGYYYKDSYFYKPATEYNHSLATMSLCMAFSTYGYGSYDQYDKNIKTLMEQCGFAEDDMYSEYHFNEKPQANSIGCAIGRKTITVDGEKIPLIAVAVRSSGYKAEWASNASVGRSGDHDGFDLSAGKVKDYLIDYISSNKIQGDIKIWITGYSRGAAVATQAAAKLDDLSGFAYPDDASESGYSRVDFDKKDIYAYGFATPAGAEKSSKPHSSDYSNVFSIIEYNDPVPLVAPEKWKFDRYGTTKMFIYRETSHKGAYNLYLDRISRRLDEGKGYNIRNFKNYVRTSMAFPQVTENPLNHDTQGTVLRKSIKALADVMGNRDKYVDKYQVLVEAAAKKFLADQPNDFNVHFSDILDAFLPKVPQFAVLHPHLSVTLIKNIKTLAEVHADNDYYLGWMQLMDENYDDNLPLAWGEPNYRVFKANCPVDMYVYDSGNNLVASIVNEVPSDDENQDIIVSIDENGQKVAYLPTDSDYRVEVKAREACHVSCEVEEYNAEYGEPTRVTNFDTVSLQSEESMTANISAFSDSELTEGADEGSEAQYTLEKNGESISIDSDLHGSDNIAGHTYSVTTVYDEAEGAVYGGGSFTEGSFARLEAQANEGYEFEGFYTNGERYESSDSTEPNTIRFKVTSNIEVEARFKVHTHTWEHIINKAGLLKNGSEYDQCTVCGIIENEKVLKGYATLYAKSLKTVRGSKSFTVKWKKQSKANQKKFAGYQIRYSLKSNMKGAKKATAKKSSASKTIKKLKKNKKYYVQVRTYTKKNGITFYSPWSKKKYVKTK